MFNVPVGEGSRSVGEVGHFFNFKFLKFTN